MVDQRGEICGVRNEIVLTFEQGSQLSHKRRVHFRFCCRTLYCGASVPVFAVFAVFFVVVFFFAGFELIARFPQDGFNQLRV